jgi:hypothetical protein
MSKRYSRLPSTAPSRFLEEDMANISGVADVDAVAPDVTKHSRVDDDDEAPTSKRHRTSPLPSPAPIHFLEEVIPNILESVSVSFDIFAADFTELGVPFVKPGRFMSQEGKNEDLAALADDSGGLPQGRFVWENVLFSGGRKVLKDEVTGKLYRGVLY